MAVDYQISHIFTAIFQRQSRRIFSPTRQVCGFYRRDGATPAACAAPRGYGIETSVSLPAMLLAGATVLRLQEGQFGEFTTDREVAVVDQKPA